MTRHEIYLSNDSDDHSLELLILNSKIEIVEIENGLCRFLLKRDFSNPFLRSMSKTHIFKNLKRDNFLVGLYQEVKDAFDGNKLQFTYFVIGPKDSITNSETTILEYFNQDKK